MVVALGLGLLAVSAAMLIAGAELFTENVAAAAHKLGITVFAAAFLLAGAEPEEMITAVIAPGRHRPGLAAGDAIGANLTMLTLVLGLAAVARPLPFGGRVRGYALWSALAGGLAALLVAGGIIGRWQGGLLLAAYLAGVAGAGTAGHRRSRRGRRGQRGRRLAARGAGAGAGAGRCHANGRRGMAGGRRGRAGGRCAAPDRHVGGTDAAGAGHDR